MSDKLMLVGNLDWPRPVEELRSIVRKLGTRRNATCARVSRATPAGRLRLDSVRENFVVEECLVVVLDKACPHGASIALELHVATVLARRTCQKLINISSPVPIARLTSIVLLLIRLLLLSLTRWLCSLSRIWSSQVINELSTTTRTFMSLLKLLLHNADNCLVKVAICSAFLRVDSASLRLYLAVATHSPGANHAVMVGVVKGGILGGIVSITLVLSVVC